MLARTGEELLKICEEESISLSEYAIRIEMREDVYKRQIFLLSSDGIIPCFPSILTWARLPSISSLYILESIEIEELKVLTNSLTPSVNLPPQSFILFILIF